MNLWLVPGDRMLRVPEGATGAAVFDLRGVRVWSWRGAASDSQAGFPLPFEVAGLMRVRLTFRE